MPLLLSRTLLLEQPLVTVILSIWVGHLGWSREEGVVEVQVMVLTRAGQLQLKWNKS